MILWLYLLIETVNVVGRISISLEDQISKQKEKLAQLLARQQKEDALKKEAEKRKNEANDARKKSLIGRHIFEHIQTDKVFEKKVMTILEKCLTSKSQRSLFGFYPLVNNNDEMVGNDETKRNGELEL